MTEPWWRDAVWYQVYLRSFADGNGDGIGDLIGLRRRLPYLASLGVDAIWITPCFRSPQVDHGYDVADYYDIEPMFGTLADLDACVDEAHALGMRVALDLVPNHTSSEHEWFKEAATDPHSAARRRYLFRPGKPDGSPPNNWRSVFGGPAWSPDPAGTGEWYLHLFAPEQPDLDWRNPEVHAEFERILRFWFDRGIDGFRIDVAHGLYKDAEFRDTAGGAGDAGIEEMDRRDRCFDQPEVHDVYRSWRALADAYDGDRVLVGEVFLWDPKQVAAYVRPDELHLAFNFLLMGQKWRASDYRRAVDMSSEAFGAVGATETWVLSNHDVVRHVDRFGGGARGRRRARAAALVQLALPGAAFVYQGDELGLPEVEVPLDARQDPLVVHTGGAHPGRDGCRVPIPWEAAGRAACGFSDVEGWLPLPPRWSRFAVDRQEADPTSHLSLYRAAISVRRELFGDAPGAVEWCDLGRGVLGFTRGGQMCVANTTTRPVTVAVPHGSALELASDAGVSLDGASLTLPRDSAAWLSSR